LGPEKHGADRKKIPEKTVFFLGCVAAEKPRIKKAEISFTPGANEMKPSSPDREMFPPPPGKFSPGKGPCPPLRPRKNLGGENRPWSRKGPPPGPPPPPRQKQTNDTLPFGPPPPPPGPDTFGAGPPPGKRGTICGPSGMFTPRTKKKKKKQKTAPPPREKPLARPPGAGRPRWEKPPATPQAPPKPFFCYSGRASFFCLTIRPPPPPLPAPPKTFRPRSPPT